MKLFLFILFSSVFISGNTFSQTKTSRKNEPLTALNGVFSLAQVASVSEVYATNCASCHGRDFLGTEGGTALKGDRFQSKWKNKSLKELYLYTKSTMPKTQPNSLDEKTYTSLIALILNANGFPSGENPLSFINNTDKTIFGTPPPARRSSGFKPAIVNQKPKTIEAEWKQHRGDFASTNYSSLEQINENNVDKLKIAWRWKTDNFGPNPEFYFKSTPLMVNGILYTTAGLSRSIAAIDGETGETLWTFRLDEKERNAYVPRQNSGRGVAYWEDKINGKDRIVFVSPSYQLVALDAKTGHLVSDFGENGIVDLKKSLESTINASTSPIGSTSPPIIVNNVIVYPSPILGNQHLNIESNSEKIIAIEIFDAIGKKIKHVNVINANLKILLDIDDISPGFYHIKIETESKAKFNSNFIKL